MSNLIDIKDRIYAVDQLQKITHAVQLVTGVNLQKVKRHWQRISSFEKSLSYIITTLRQHLIAAAATAQQNLLTGRSKVNKHLVIVMSCDMGLNGDFNVKLYQGLQEFLSHLSMKEEVMILCMGKQIHRLLKQRPEYKKLLYSIDDEMSEDNLNDMGLLADNIRHKFYEKAFDRCTILYTHHISTIRREVHALMVVPCLFAIGEQNDIPSHVQGNLDETKVRSIDTAYFGTDQIKTGQKDEKNEDFSYDEHCLYDYEPDVNQILAGLEMRHLSYWIELCHVDSKISEYSSRLLAMDRANSNARDIIKSSKLLYNKIRQHNVTRELIEIISAAELMHAQEEFR